MGIPNFLTDGFGAQAPFTAQDGNVVPFHVTT
jgi:hypothetical protein